MRTLFGDLAKRAFARLAVVPSRLFGDRARSASAVLTYHRVAPRTSGLTPSAGDVAPEQFRAQLAGLRAMGYQFIRLAELLECHAAGRTPGPRRLVLTFDDGYECVFRYALPVLEEFRAPATVFLATSFLDSDGPFPFEPWGVRYHARTAPEVWRPLSTAQCQTMAASGLVALAAHTHTHEDFRGRAAELQADLVECVGVLRRRFGVERPAFAYPWGNASLGFAGDELRETARDSGVSCALSTVCESIDVRNDPFTWGRYTACRWDNSASLAAKARGWYGWGPRLFGRWLKWRCRNSGSDSGYEKGCLPALMETKETVGT